MKGVLICHFISTTIYIYTTPAKGDATSLTDLTNKDVDHKGMIIY